GAEVDPGAAGLLGEDGVVFERLDAGPAVLLGDLDAEDAELTELAVELGGDLAGLEPVGVVGHHLGLDEPADGLAEGLVVLVVESATHGRQPTQASATIASTSAPYLSILDRPTPLIFNSARSSAGFCSAIACSVRSV